MTELPQHDVTTESHRAEDAVSQAMSANKYALKFLVGTGTMLLGELLFAGSEFVERAVAETRLFNEFLAKAAEAHSVKGIGTMNIECARHQLEFVRRDTERLFRHGERMIDNAAKLMETLRPS
jgi:hypothetical protein